MGVVRPRVVLSQCLELAACRYDGARIPSGEVRALTQHVTWVPLCPEVAIGLGVPRAPIRIERDEWGDRLVQPSTGRDLTERMEVYGSSFADATAAVDGLLLKSRSPSCGVGDVKIHMEGVPVGTDGRGMFARVVAERYPDAACTDEVRLRDPEHRHHWLTRTWASARLREAAARGVPGLVDFHTRYKLVLMAHSPSAQRTLGRLVAEAAPSSEAGAVMAEYRAGVMAALAEPAGRGATLNAVQHAQGYFKRELDPGEKREFLGLQAEYRAGRLPFPSLLAVLWDWVERFDEPYLRQQAFLRPYPRALL